MHAVHTNVHGLPATKANSKKQLDSCEFIFYTFYKWHLKRKRELKSDGMLNLNIEILLIMRI